MAGNGNGREGSTGSCGNGLGGSGLDGSGLDGSGLGGGTTVGRAGLGGVAAVGGSPRARGAGPHSTGSVFGATSPVGSGESGARPARVPGPRAPLRLGVVGLGVISRFYLAAIADDPAFELAAVCDLDPTALAAHPVPAFTDHRVMLASADLDAVVVTTPNDVHAAVCRDVVAAGLPVCVEKPLATDLADGVALVAAARAGGVALFTAFHRRYNSTLLALRDKLVGGPPVEWLRVRYLERIEEHVGADRWYLDAARCGGGCVADNGPNALDVARLFVGPLRLDSAEVERDAAGVDRRALLRLWGSAPVEVELDWSFPGERKDVEVRLADGTVLRADALEGHSGFKSSLWHEYAGVLRDFGRAARAGADWADGGLAALAIVDEVYRREAR